MSVTTAEMEAAKEAILQRQGEVAARAFSKGSSTSKEHRIRVLEESAAAYVAEGGEDPLAKKVVEAAKKAGIVNKDGEFVGPNTDAVAAKDPQTASNSCC